MKTIKIILLAFILVGTNLAEAYSKVVITIVIARHRDCEGFGLCKISAEGTIPLNRNTGHATADIDGAGHFKLTINKNTDLTPEAFDKYFSNGVFVCEDDFPVPTEVLKSLGYTRNYTITKGNYNITTGRDGLMTITF